MELQIKASDLYYLYKRHPRPDADRQLFDRDCLEDVLPMLARVMAAVGRDDVTALHHLEELMLLKMPQFIRRHDEVYDFLFNCMRDTLAGQG